MTQNTASELALWPLEERCVADEDAMSLSWLNSAMDSELLDGLAVADKY